MSSSRPEVHASPSPSPSPSPLASPRDPPRLDTTPTPTQRARPRPKLVSFNRDSLGGGRPNTEGSPHVDFIDQVDEHSPSMPPQGRMSSEVDPLLKETMSPLGSDDDWLGEQQTEETKSSWFLFLLTFCGLGLQIGWSVETSNGSVCPLSVHPLPYAVSDSICSPICCRLVSASPCLLSSGLQVHSQVSLFNLTLVSKVIIAECTGVKGGHSLSAVPLRPYFR